MPINKTEPERDAEAEQLIEWWKRGIHARSILRRPRGRKLPGPAVRGSRTARMRLLPGATTRGAQIEMPALTQAFHAARLTAPVPRGFKRPPLCSAAGFNAGTHP
jgi:hypothetical protein